MTVHRIGPTITVAALVAGALAGCASAPRSAVGRPAPPQIVTMAPIPNPEPEHHTRSVRAEGSTRHTPPPEAKPAEPPPAPAKAAAPAAVVQDHARATRLRAKGLEQLNRGAIDQAVALLQAAAKLEPSNALIQRDLERALRISRAVHTRR